MVGAKKRVFLKIPYNRSENKGLGAHMEKYEGDVVDVIYYNEENGYAVAVLETNQDYMTIVGILFDIKEEEHLIVEGDWTTNAKFGKQFNVKQHTFVLPQKKDDILRYLASGIIKGVGESMAKRIVDAFGDDTFYILQMAPHRLTEIEGIGEKKSETILASFQEQQESREVMIFLQKYGIRPHMAGKIYKRFGKKSEALIRENPYMLCSEKIGIGFKTADEIAAKMGIEKASPYRIGAALLYVLGEASLNGHVYLPREEWVQKTQRLIGIDLRSIDTIYKNLMFEGKIKSEHKEGVECVYTMANYVSESEVAALIFTLQNGEKQPISVDMERIFTELEGQRGLSLADNQKSAVIESTQNGVLVITGGPGTGKTTTINTILQVFERDDKKILLAAPTGRAAKRMQEATGYEAKTIHRLLEYSFSETHGEMRFTRNEKNPLEGDLIVVDEASMIDIKIMAQLLCAVPKEARLILVGDADQLPSVGPGNVLRDIISSQYIKVVRLDEIFRQASASMIIVNAHKINHGAFPILNEKGRDFFFIHCHQEKLALQEIVSLYRKRLPEFMGFAVSEDNIQILSPGKKGLLGVEHLNQVLQEEVNPQKEGKAEKKFGMGLFREGDRVMQVRNQYDLEWELLKEGFVIGQGQGIFNGDLGKIEKIDTKNNEMQILFDEEKRVHYDFSLLEDLKLAYASTVHKSQGSEFKVVIMPMLGIPFKLLSRNLLYTGITRAQSLVVLVGNEAILRKMIENDHVFHRYTALDDKIKKMMEMYDVHKMD